MPEGLGVYIVCMIIYCDDDMGWLWMVCILENRTDDTFSYRRRRRSSKKKNDEKLVKKCTHSTKWDRNMLSFHVT